VILRYLVTIANLLTGGSTVVELSTHHRKVKGSSQATASWSKGGGYREFFSPIADPKPPYDDEAISGATTFSITIFSIMTFSITTLSITTFIIMTFSKMTFSIMTQGIMTFSIMILSITTPGIMTLSITFK
jgi:hypothetical protein